MDDLAQRHTVTLPGREQKENYVAGPRCILQAMPVDDDTISAADEGGEG
jgi:hypothetical protein